MSVRETPKRPTMADVGRLAGVSAATVSFVLNPGSQQTISAATRARVMQAVNDLDYRPNRAAQALRGIRHGALGVVVDEAATEIYNGQIIAGVQDVARGAGRVVYVMHSGRLSEGLEIAAEELAALRVEALLYIATGTREVTPPLSAGGDTPVVMINCFPPAAPSGESAGRHPAASITRHPSGGRGAVEPTQDAVRCILPDEVSGGAAATRMLVDAGHRHIAYLTGNSDSWATIRRLQGFRAALADAGLDPDGQPVLPGEFYVASGLRLADDLLRLDPRPTGVLCGNDRMALGVYFALLRAGVRIPEDISVVGYDDQEPVVLEIPPPLSTVCLPLYEMGHLAATAVVEGRLAELPAQTLVPCPPVPRASVAAPSR